MYQSLRVLLSVSLDAAMHMLAYSCAQDGCVHKDVNKFDRASLKNVVTLLAHIGEYFYVLLCANDFQMNMSIIMSAMYYCHAKMRFFGFVFCHTRHNQLSTTQSD